MEKIQIKHPDPTKKTVAIGKEKYEILKKSLIEGFKFQQVMTFKEMLRIVTEDLKNQNIIFQGSIQWHLAWVQTDMEARDELIKDSTSSPQKFKLANKS